MGFIIKYVPNLQSHQDTPDTGHLAGDQNPRETGQTSRFLLTCKSYGFPALTRKLSKMLVCAKWTFSSKKPCSSSKRLGLRTPREHRKEILKMSEISYEIKRRFAMEKARGVGTQSSFNAGRTLPATTSHRS